MPQGLWSVPYLTTPRGALPPRERQNGAGESDQETIPSRRYRQNSTTCRPNKLQNAGQEHQGWSFVSLR